MKSKFVQTKKNHSNEIQICLNVIKICSNEIQISQTIWTFEQICSNEIQICSNVIKVHSNEMKICSGSIFMIWKRKIHDNIITLTLY